MKRPTKPVMWTDEEANERLKDWLKADGWKIGKPNFLTRLSLIKKGDLFFNLLNYEVSAEYIARLDKAVSIITKHKLITPDSLLYDLNIIKPIGRLEYTSEWIDKILSGQKTMSIRKTQYMCGYYELWDTDQQEVRGIVEVTAVFKYEFSMPRPHGSEKKGIIVHSCLVETVSDWDAWHKLNADIHSACGMTNKEFIDHHRTHFQSVKYAITYQVVDMKGDGK